MSKAGNSQLYQSPFFATDLEISKGKFRASHLHAPTVLYIYIYGALKLSLKGSSLWFYHCTRVDDESSSNLCVLIGKHQCFSIFMTLT